MHSVVKTTIAKTPAAAATDAAAIPSSQAMPGCRVAGRKKKDALTVVIALAGGSFVDGDEDEDSMRGSMCDEPSEKGPGG